jgi:hypothetical protein
MSVMLQLGTHGIQMKAACQGRILATGIPPLTQEDVMLSDNDLSQRLTKEH